MYPDVYRQEESDDGDRDEPKIAWKFFPVNACGESDGRKEEKEDRFSCQTQAKKETGEEREYSTAWFVREYAVRSEEKREKEKHPRNFTKDVFPISIKRGKCRDEECGKERVTRPMKFFSEQEGGSGAEQHEHDHDGTRLKNTHAEERERRGDRENNRKPGRRERGREEDARRKLDFHFAHANEADRELNDHAFIAPHRGTFGEFPGAKGKRREKDEGERKALEDVFHCEKSTEFRWAAQWKGFPARPSYRRMLPCRFGVSGAAERLMRPVAAGTAVISIRSGTAFRSFWTRKE